jgi:hypothetical protein
MRFPYLSYICAYLRALFIFVSSKWWGNYHFAVDLFVFLPQELHSSECLFAVTDII